jgi:hypothetical protein
MGLSVRLDPERSYRGDWIRTSDLPVPNRTLYQAEPRPDDYASRLRSLGYSVPRSRTERFGTIYLGILAISRDLGNWGGN